MKEQANHETTTAEAKQELSRMGYDPATFYEQRVVWGDHDTFQCVFSKRAAPEGLLINDSWIPSDT